MGAKKPNALFRTPVFLWHKVSLLTENSNGLLLTSMMMLALSPRRLFIRVILFSGGFEFESMEGFGGVESCVHNSFFLWNKKKFQLGVSSDTLCEAFEPNTFPSTSGWTMFCSRAERKLGEFSQCRRDQGLIWGEKGVRNKKAIGIDCFAFYTDTGGFFRSEN